MTNMTELYDLEEIKRADTILFESADIVEARALNTPKKTQIGFYNDRDKMARDIAALSGHASGVYNILNQINPALLARSANQLKLYADSGDGASDKDIIRRRFLPIDADPIRPSGISSTDSEHDAALDKAFHISGYLHDTLSFPADSMLLADSGNGAHLLIRIDLPNDAESTNLIKKCLKSLAYLFDDDKIQIDTSVYNPARIWKAYGTLACKGSDTPERPHRIAKLLIAPDKVVLAPKKSLERLAAIAPDDPKPTQTHIGEKFDLTTWLSVHGINVKRVSKWETWDKFELECCPFDAAHTGSSVCILQNANGAIAFKCMHSGCQGKEWADVRELKEPGYRDVIRNNSYIYNGIPDTHNNSETFQNRDKTVTDSFQKRANSFTQNGGEKKQNYSARFDEVLKEAGKMSRRDISVTISLQHTSDTFRQIVSRRLRDGVIRPYRGSADVLEWVNKDYQFLTMADYRAQANLKITLPLDLNKHVNVPAGSVIGVAGYTSAGKTAFLLEIAELNVISQDLPVYHWFNEMSSDRMLLRLEDYPLLVTELGRKFKAVKQTNFEFYDVIEPDAINIIDYLDLDGGEGENNQVFMIGAVIKKLQRRLGKGIVIFALQKKEASDMGYGGVYSAKLSNLYLSLDTIKQEDTRMMGRCKIVKSKDWGEMNPVGLCCNYYTGGKHGKIMSDNVWRRD
jgi:hypothetical protein